MSDDEQSEQQHLVTMTAFAEREGFALSLLFVEMRWQRTLALNALVAYCKSHDIRNVIVPSSQHLNHLPVLADLSKDALQEDIGGQVWIVAPTDEESSSSVVSKGGGSQ